LEHGYDQAAAVRALLLAQGFEQVSSRLDLNRIERCSGGVIGAPDSADDLRNAAASSLVNLLKGARSSEAAKALSFDDVDALILSGTKA
jgi:hypothetical protein